MTVLTADVHARTEAARIRLLLIDDDELVLRAIVRLLRRDAVVSPVCDAEGATRLLEEGERFDVLLTDLSLGATCGVAVLEQVVRRFGAQVGRVGVFSGRAPTAEEEARLLALPVPALVVQKPAGREALLAAMRPPPLP